MTVLIYWEPDGDFMMKFIPRDVEFLQDLKDTIPEAWRYWDSIYAVWRMKEEAWPKLQLVIKEHDAEVRTLWPRAQSES